MRRARAVENAVQRLHGKCGAALADDRPGLPFHLGVQHRRRVIPVAADAELETVDDALAMPAQERQVRGVEIQRRDRLSRPEGEGVRNEVAARHVQGDVRDRAWHAVLQFRPPVGQQAGAVGQQRGKTVAARDQRRQDIRHRSLGETTRRGESNVLRDYGVTAVPSKYVCALAQTRAPICRPIFREARSPS